MLTRWKFAHYEIPNRNASAGNLAIVHHSCSFMENNQSHPFYSEPDNWSYACVASYQRLLKNLLPHTESDDNNKEMAEYRTRGSLSNEPQFVCAFDPKTAVYE